MANRTLDDRKLELIDSLWRAWMRARFYSCLRAHESGRALAAPLPATETMAHPRTLLLRDSPGLLAGALKIVRQMIFPNLDLCLQAVLCLQQVFKTTRGQ